MPVINNNQNQFAYDPYWTDKQLKEGLDNGTLLQGKLRINQRNFEDAFVSDSVRIEYILKIDHSN